MASLILTFFLLCTYVTLGTSAGKVPAILIFGDSTVDTGNNNFIWTAFKANHVPYGLHFSSSNGRFSDGKLVPDMLASALGIKQLVPPFLNPTLSTDDLMTGVCFASAASGYDDLTVATTKAIPMSKQPQMFQQYVRRLQQAVGNAKTTQIVNNALILFSAGTNDFALNYYVSPIRKSQYSIDAFQDFLQQRLQQFIKEVYNLGGRKFAVAGMAPIGCMPALRNPFDRTCSQEKNADAIAYNKKLKVVLDETQAFLPGSKIVYVDLYEPAMDMMTNPSKYGFEEVTKGCCGSGILEAGPLCTVLSGLCSSPNKYMFFDSFHPSERVYREITNIALQDIVPKLY